MSGHTYRLRSGEYVTSKDGDWPTQYTNRTQAERAAAKIDGATVIQRGRPFYVKLGDIVCPDGPTCPDTGCIDERTKRGLVCQHNTQIERPDDPTHAWQCADCGYVYGQEEANVTRESEPAEPVHPATGEPTNEARSNRVFTAISSYAQKNYGLKADREDYDTVLQDFLTDVLHFAQEQGIDPEDVTRRALDMFRQELEAES